MAAVNLELEAVHHVACDVDLDPNLWVRARADPVCPVVVFQ